MESAPCAAATGAQASSLAFPRRRDNAATGTAALQSTRSHPPPQAGCPRGDPGPLAVLTSSAPTELGNPTLEDLGNRLKGSALLVCCCCALKQNGISPVGT